MGYDDGDCEISPTGQHELDRSQLVLNGRGLIDQVHRCMHCGVEAYDPSAGQEASRPPL